MSKKFFKIRLKLKHKRRLKRKIDELRKEYGNVVSVEAVLDAADIKVVRHRCV